MQFITIGMIARSKNMIYQQRLKDGQYLFACCRGHQVILTSEALSGADWCPRCGGRIFTLESYKNLAERYGLTCQEVVLPPNEFEPVFWECDKGHSIELSFYDINQAQGCTECRKEGLKKRIDIIPVKDIGEGIWA